ncbi:MAG: hypothetical protein ACPIOQ_11235 [Promethearchaeia archaeon]
MVGLGRVAETSGPYGMHSRPYMILLYARMLACVCVCVCVCVRACAMPIRTQ